MGQGSFEILRHTSASFNSTKCSPFIVLLHGISVIIRPIGKCFVIGICSSHQCLQALRILVTNHPIYFHGVVSILTLAIPSLFHPDLSPHPLPSSLSPLILLPSPPPFSSLPPSPLPLHHPFLFISPPSRSLRHPPTPLVKIRKAKVNTLYEFFPNLDLAQCVMNPTNHT